MHEVGTASALINLISPQLDDDRDKYSYFLDEVHQYQILTAGSVCYKVHLDSWWLVQKDLDFSNK